MPIQNIQTEYFDNTMSKQKTLNKNDIFFGPWELLFKILLLLSPWELCQFSAVCRYFRETTNTNCLWHYHCRVRGWFHGSVSATIKSESPLSTHKANVSDTFAPVEYIGYMLISGSDDKSLKVWDIRTCECVRAIGGHSDAISALKIYKGQFVITGCEDSCIRIFDIKTGRIVLSFHGHSGSVDHIHVIDHLIVSAASDRTIRVWSIKNQCLLRTLRGHDDEIECLAVYGRHFVSGSWDNTLIMWSVDRDYAVVHFVGHTEAVTAVQFDDENMISGSADGDVIIWDPSCGRSVRTLTTSEPNSEVYCLSYNADVISAGYSDSFVRIWGFDGCLLHRLQEHLGVVRCLHINHERLISAGDQKKIVVWDYRAGKKFHVVHRQPTHLQRMMVTGTMIITSSPDAPGTLSLLSYW